MNDTTAPARNLAQGDRIEHDLMPGFAMTIQATALCETDGSRPEPHAKYKITDPDGNEDWLCAYDVHAAPLITGRHPRRDGATYPLHD